MLQRSLKILSDVRIRREEGKPLIIALRALGKGFAPRSFDGAKVSLHIVSAGYGARDINGTLHVVEAPEGRGLWYQYRFQPLHEVELNGVVSWGLNGFSPVESIVFILQGTGYKKTNPFFISRPPPPKPVT